MVKLDGGFNTGSVLCESWVCVVRIESTGQDCFKASHVGRAWPGVCSGYALACDELILPVVGIWLVLGVPELDTCDGLKVGKGGAAVQNCGSGVFHPLVKISCLVKPKD